MSLSDIVEGITPSVVALGHRIEYGELNEQGRLKNEPAFPQILGTGFVVDSRGLIATNRHVADALKQQPVDLTFVSFFITKLLPNNMLWNGSYRVSVKEYFPLPSLDEVGTAFWDTQPDLEFISVDLQGIPSLSLCGAGGTIRMGTDIVVAGFPDGRDKLNPQNRAHLSQFVPFVRRGIVSSTLPGPVKFPKAFTIDVATESGMSGSPICRSEDGCAIGILTSSYEKVPLTYCVPGNLLVSGRQLVLDHYWKPDPKALHWQDITNPAALKESKMKWRPHREPST